MNVSFARRVQLSIMDQSVPFDMNQWDKCIAGHCRRVAQLEGMDTPGLYENISSFATCCLDISREEAHALFINFPFREEINRYSAVNRLDGLIAAYEQPEPEPQLTLGGKPRSRSARPSPDLEQLQEAVAAAPVSPYWHGLSPVSFVDLTEVNKILQEANLELVGV